MELHQSAAAVLGVVPRTPGDLRFRLSQALQVLTTDDRMLWSFVALVLAGLFLALARTPRATLVCALAVAVTSFVWLRANQLHEGRVLVRFSASHGLTEADLLVPLVVITAGVCWLAGQTLRRRRLTRRRRRVRALLPTL
ncbi:hypothetical protein KIH74_24510 [Kineosporia sp. J2-2]|uniref:Uncharacterized protein n=1 Tax=Kineosporia corallincola TaxID=2835133 RepID=A0ABS5TLZ9_9ACTN|nr:hypothetical protein [Kineosporia corallincola]MBT0772129.1 hypothetical protein [Kineosporia corallincola]